MKKSLIAGLIAALLCGGVASAGPDRRVAGAVLGTAAGLIIANNVHGVNPWVAVIPVAALLTGLLLWIESAGL